MDRVEQFEPYDPVQEARDFLDSLGSKHTSHETRPFIFLLKRMLASGDWEPSDSGKHQVWEIIKQRFSESDRADEREACVQLMVALRNQDMQKTKLLIELLDRMMGVAPAPLVTLNMTGDAEPAPQASAPPQSGPTISQILERLEAPRAVEE